MNWQLIQESFRGAFEGALLGFVVLVLLGISLPILWHIWKERYQRSRRLKQVKRRMIARGIAPQEWRMLETAIQSTCPDNPSRLLDSVSLFHTWIDGLPEIESPPPGLLGTITRIKELAYPQSHNPSVPHSTRDLVPGASLNVVTRRSGQEVIPCIVTELTMEGIRLGKRGANLPATSPGETISLFYPRPEAMYNAIVKVQEASATEIRVAHALQGQFKVRQLREFWRVDVDLDLNFVVVQEPDQSLQSSIADAGESRAGRLINLSGNGAAIVTKHPPERGSRISFTLALPGKTLHDLQSEVLHITRIREISRLHLVFRNLDPGDQESIIRNLFILYREHGNPEQETPVVDLAKP